jgi:hypothetical protein
VQTGEWSPEPSSERRAIAANRCEFALAGRGVDLERRAAALTRIERAIALTPVPATYFDADRSSNAGDWWAKQLVSMAPESPPV